VSGLPSPAPAMLKPLALPIRPMPGVRDVAAPLLLPCQHMAHRVKQVTRVIRMVDRLTCS
jgi:hypothetical protein